MNYRAAIVTLGVGVCLGGGMNIARAADAGRDAASAQKFDEQGNVVRVGPVRNAVPLPGLTTACFELDTLGTTTFKVQAQVNINAYPFSIVGGFITGTLCDAANWSVKSGSLGTSVTINAIYNGTSTCADSMTIIGNFATPDVYIGTYGFGGASGPATQKLFFKGWGGC